jgi:hypothetical protein
VGAAKEDAKAKLAKITDRVKALATEDLADLNAQYLLICRAELGTYQPREGRRHPYMSHSEVPT